MGDEPGISTFVGRVRGTFSDEDEEWLQSTSDSVATLRSDMVIAARRLGRIEQHLADHARGRADTGDPVSGARPEEVDGDEWDRLVAWAAAVNAALVGLANRRGLPSSFDVAATGAIAAEQAIGEVSARTVELGRALREVRGEQVVDELLSAGILVGPPGSTDFLAFEDHGAWDIEFLGAAGATLARADVRLTGDPGEVLDHLSTRPGVDVVFTTTDAADGLADSPEVTILRPGEAWPIDPSLPVVVDVGSESTALHADLVQVLDAVDPGGTADALLEAVPFLALLVVGTRAAARAATTADAGSDIASGAWQQTKDVVTTAGVSELVGWVSGMSLLKVPTTLTFALGRAAVRDARGAVALSGRRVARSRRLIGVVRSSSARTDD
ncbi:MAG: hypothetical protein ACXIVQ_16855 [Acidimicrobiales bacterium]